MTISNIKLTDKFHVWVAATNLIIEEINREIVLEAKQQLKTIDKSTLVNAINELVDKKLDKDQDLDISSNNINVNSILANTKIQVGSEGNNNSIIEFYDDINNIYRKFLFSSDERKWYIENINGELEEILTTGSSIDGNIQSILIKGLGDDEFNTYTGQERTLSYNLVTKEVRVHDGFTQGGIPLLNPDIILDKTKVNEYDGVSGYLSDKIVAGKDIQITQEQEKGSIRLVISNGLSGQFLNPEANTFIKRSSDNKSFSFLHKNDFVNELDLGKIYSNIKTFTNDIVLEDNIYTYVTNISDTTNISIAAGDLTHNNQMYEFELVINLTEVSSIQFIDNIKWNNNVLPSFNEVGTYIYKFKTLDNGTTWLAKLDSTYI